MAKHAKKNNIISYDEAKLKKLREREEQNKSAAKHFRDDFDEIEELEGDGYYDDAENDIEYNDYREDTHHRLARRGRQPDTDDFEDDDEEYERSEARSPRYNQPKQRLPQNLINIIIVVLMTGFLIFISSMLYNFYVVETINVYGNDTVKYHDITELCGVEYKQSMLSVKTEDIIDSFENQLPMIEVVEVKKKWPNILDIWVQERQPVCYLVLKGSQMCALIGENNICLAVEESYLKGDMPRIYGLDVGTGELGKEITDGETRKLEVLKMITAAMKETDCIAELESININNTTNIIMMSTSGTTVKIGDTTNLVVKFKNTKLGIRRLIAENNTKVTMIVTGDNSFYTID